VFLDNQVTRLSSQIIQIRFPYKDVVLAYSTAVPNRFSGTEVKIHSVFFGKQSGLVLQSSHSVVISLRRKNRTWNRSWPNL